MDHRRTAATRVLYLALDACDPGTMVGLAEAGICPNIGRLLDDAAVVETVAPYGTFVGSTWKTVATGLEVGHHRYYNWVQLAEGQYDMRLTSPREALGPPFWETLSDRGRRIAVLDVPHSDIPESFNGVLLKEWGCHDRHHGTASMPPEVLDELDGITGGHPYGSCPPPRDDDQFAPCDYTLRAGVHRTLDEQRQLFDLIVAGVEAKRRASLHLLEAGGWDLFLSVFGESHCVGHQLWHVHQEDHPRHDPAARRILGDPVLEVYQRLDAVVGDHLAQVDGDTTCYVHLSHGMQSHFDGDHLLDEVLAATRRRRPVTGADRVAHPHRALGPRPCSGIRCPAAAAACRRGCPPPRRGRASADGDQPWAPSGPSLVPDPEQHRRERGAVQRDRAGPLRARR